MLASDTAPLGSRSEADFALCCWAVEHGMTSEAVWAEVQSIGKFSGDERYFDRTWTAAESHTRETILDKVHGGKTAEKLRRNCEHGVQDDHARGAGGRPKILVDSETMPVGDTLHEVTNRLLATGHCFSRANQLVVVHDDTIAPIISSPELAGLLNQHVEFFFVDAEAGEYKPLPANYGNTWLNQRAERSRLPVIKLFTRNPVYTDDWRLVAPGYDPPSGIYYAGPAVEPRDNTEHLDTLLRDFCFRTPADRTNYIGMLPPIWKIELRNSKACVEPRPMSMQQRVAKLERLVADRIRERRRRLKRLKRHGVQRVAPWAGSCV